MSCLVCKMPRYNNDGRTAKFVHTGGGGGGSGHGQGGRGGGFQGGKFNGKNITHFSLSNLKIIFTYFLR